MSTTTVSADIRSAAAEASENAGPFPGLAPTVVDDASMRSALHLGTLQRGLQRAEIDSLRDDNARLTNALNGAADLLIAAAYGLSDEVCDFASRMANEMRAKTRHQGGTNG